MSRFPEPPRESFDAVNPYRAPVADIQPALDELPIDSDAEAIRRTHIGHEASVKSVGALLYLNGVFSLLVAVVYIAVAANMMGAAGDLEGLDAWAVRPAAAFLAVVALAMTALTFSTGYGLRRLQNWARWVTVTLMGLSLAYVFMVALMFLLVDPFAGLVALLVGSLIPGYILYLMVAPRSFTVFSPEYKVVVTRTPHVKYKTSLLVKILIALLLVLIVVIIVAALTGPR